ncbi:glycosyltransferase family 1 protein [Ceratobasidium sp. AG-Ba]|nr:glycosyltransferase family 1 protein [Ceratobasidium sp. AG-Ba]QRW06834.1 glycosyltransferase family 1 protein [Ceratobasidium sp. AG-Ba]
MSHPILKHVVFITGFGWTHVRPNLHFCMRFAAKFSDVFISVYTPDIFITQISQYLATYPKTASDRIRIVTSVLDAPVKSPLDPLYGMERNFGPWVTGQITGASFEYKGRLVGAPSYIIEDHVCGGISVTSKESHNLPIIGWYVATSAAIIGYFGNAEHGEGSRLFEATCAAIEKRGPDSGKPFGEIFNQVLISDRVICAPGVSPHYEHEQIPQPQPAILPFLLHVHKRWVSMLKHINGMIYTSLYEMEPITAEASAIGLIKPIPSFCTGLAADLPGSVRPDYTDNESDPVISFMDHAYNDLGAHSVVYIAFGSHFFPAAESASHFKILIEEILSQNLRVVISVKRENAIAVGLSEDYLGRLTDSGGAIFPEWTKQLEVLEHPAIHYFVSHGGWNSTAEAIVRGVPMIFWPMAADQPINAMQMTRQHDCGFELLQVRRGPARSTAYTPYGDILITGSDEAVRKEVQNILKMSKGQRGVQQRLNMRALGKVAVESYEAGGSADAALSKLGNIMGL